MSIYLRKTDARLTGISLLDCIEKSYPYYLNNEKFWSIRLNSDMGKYQQLYPKCKEWNKLTSYQKYKYLSTNYCEPIINITIDYTIGKNDPKVLAKKAESHISSVTTKLLSEIFNCPVVSFRGTIVDNILRYTGKYLLLPINRTKVEDVISHISKLYKQYPLTFVYVDLVDHKLVDAYNPFNENYLEYTIVTPVSEYTSHPSRLQSSMLAGLLHGKIKESRFHPSVEDEEFSYTRVRLYLLDNDKCKIVDSLHDIHRCMRIKGQLIIH